MLQQLPLSIRPPSSQKKVEGAVFFHCTKHRNDDTRVNVTFIFREVDPGQRIPPPKVRSTCHIRDERK